MKVSSYRIFVQDVSDSAAWYKKLFKLEPIETQESFTAFDLSGTRFEIVLADAKNPFALGGSVSYWLVDDIDLVLRNAQELGGKLYRGPLSVAETKSRIMQIQDPYGNVIGFESK